MSGVTILGDRTTVGRPQNLWTFVLDTLRLTQRSLRLSIRMPALIIREIWVTGVGAAAITRSTPSTRCDRNSDKSSLWRSPLSSEFTAISA